MVSNKDYNPNLEDFKFLRSLPPIPQDTQEWKVFARPEEVDIDWHRTEDQKRMGSCTANGTTSAMERVFEVAGDLIQLSRIFMYLATQKLDGLLGRDSGSTISNAARVALNGCPLESLTGYPTNYPNAAARAKILSKEMYIAGEPYKVPKVWQVPQDYGKILDFLGGGGAVAFGIRYYHGLIPSDRIIRDFSVRPRSGGHAMAVLGYTKDGELRAVNSHADGPYIITEKAWMKMLRDGFTSAVGYIGNDAKPVDWYKNSPYYKLKAKDNLDIIHPSDKPEDKDEEEKKD
jgi:hypothetical protein